MLKLFYSEIVQLEVPQHVLYVRIRGVEKVSHVEIVGDVLLGHGCGVRQDLPTVCGDAPRPHDVGRPWDHTYAVTEAEEKNLGLLGISLCRWRRC